MRALFFGILWYCASKYLNKSLKQIHMNIRNFDVVIGKFGGNALKDANAFKALPGIVDEEMTAQSNVLVVSATGSTTRELDKVFKQYENRNKKEAIDLLDGILYTHEEICWTLFPEDNTLAIDEIRKSIKCTAEYISGNYPLNEKKEQAHAKILSLGEVLSWHIVSAYLVYNGIENFKLDSREVVKTIGEKYTNAIVDIPQTLQKISNTFSSYEYLPRYIVCQGFIGSKTTSNTTTLGYEGSYYSASVYAACFGGYLKFFKEFAYHDLDPDIYPNAEHLESVNIDDLTRDVNRTDKKPILHRLTLEVMKEFKISGEIISHNNLNKRTRIVF